MNPPRLNATAMNIEPGCGILVTARCVGGLVLHYGAATALLLGRVRVVSLIDLGEY